MSAETPAPETLAAVFTAPEGGGGEFPAPLYSLFTQPQPEHGRVYLAIMEDERQLAWITFDTAEQFTQPQANLALAGSKVWPETAG